MRRRRIGIGALGLTLGRPNLLLLTLTLLLSGSVSSPALPFEGHDPPAAVHRERPRFAFDAGAIWRADTAWVVVDVGVPYRELMFRLDGDQYRASFDLIVVLYDGKRQVTGDLWRESVSTRDYTETRGNSRSFRRTIWLPARPGKLRTEVTVSEPSSGNEGHQSQDLQIPDFDDDPLVLGKIWFGTCPGDSGEVECLVPEKPQMSRRFGSVTTSVCVWSWLRVPPEAIEGPIVVEWEIRDERHRRITSDQVGFSLAGDLIPVRFPIDLRNLWLGGYQLTLKTEVAGRTAVRRVDFEMDESTVSFDQNPDLSLSLIRYIATGEEMEKLENALPEERQREWNEFWKRRDPAPETEENEFKVEFFRRVRYANEHFGAIGAGWKSDRGMIYIQYGPPDQIASYPHNIDGPPHEVWTYNAQRRRFVFVDYNGFGRYELATPGRL